MSPCFRVAYEIVVVHVQLSGKQEPGSSFSWGGDLVPGLVRSTPSVGGGLFQ